MIGELKAMPDPRVIVMVLGLSMILPAWYRGWVSFSQLIYLECTLYPDAWFSDGRPIALLVRRSQYPAVPSTLAATRCSVRWLFSTPEWALEDPQALKCLRQFRESNVLWLCGLLLIIGSVIAFR